MWGGSRVILLSQGQRERGKPRHATPEHCSTCQHPASGATPPRGHTHTHTQLHIARTNETQRCTGWHTPPPHQPWPRDTYIARMQIAQIEQDMCWGCLGMRCRPPRLNKGEPTLYCRNNVWQWRPPYARQFGAQPCQPPGPAPPIRPPPPPDRTWRKQRRN